MRLWSIHPRYLDAKGLVALWREALLARKVLAGETRGYRNHPQLERFRRAASPLDAINEYLEAVYLEAEARGYKFDRSKLGAYSGHTTITVTTGQLEYETLHLLEKLKRRDPERYDRLKGVKILDPHPMFLVVEGGVEPWEVVKPTRGLGPGREAAEPRERFPASASSLSTGYSRPPPPEPRRC